MKLYLIISFALAIALYLTLVVLATLFGNMPVPLWGGIVSAAIMLNFIIASTTLIYKIIKL